jgi:hypothetical protein
VHDDSRKDAADYGRWLEWVRTPWKVVAAVAILVIAAFAYVSLFSRFSAPDDEGYNVAMIRLVSEGTPLYTGQFAVYGPFPYLSKAAMLALKARQWRDIPDPIGSGRALRLGPRGTASEREETPARPYRRKTRQKPP